MRKASKDFASMGFDPLEIETEMRNSPSYEKMSENTISPERLNPLNRTYILSKNEKKFREEQNRYAELARETQGTGYNLITCFMKN